MDQGHRAVEGAPQSCRDRLDEDDVPKADSLLLVDQAEAYALCSACYHENRDGAWTGSTQNPSHHEIQ